MKKDQTFRTYKRNGIYYVSYDKGKKAKWTSTGLSANFAIKPYTPIRRLF